MDDKKISTWSDDIEKFITIIQNAPQQQPETVQNPQPSQQPNPPQNQTENK
jgi:hypothetical protein